MSNSRAISRRRGTKEQHDSFTGVNAEITVDTTNNRAVVHDGETAGGHPMAPVAYVDDKASLLSDDLIETEGKAKVASNVPNNHPDTDDLTTPICFIFDSIRKELIEDFDRGNGFPSGGFKEIFESKGVKFSMSGRMGLDYWDDNNISLQDALNLQSEGYNLMAHVRVSDNPDFNDAQIEQQIKDQKDEIISQGINPKNANYLQGINTIAARSVIRKYYRSAGIVGPGDQPIPNTRPINQFALRRLSMDSGNYNNWVKQADLAIENNALMIFYGHAYTDEWYTTLKDDDGNPDEAGDYTWEKIGRLIDYIQAKLDYGQPGGVDIVQVDDALDSFENIVDTGFARDFRDSIYTDEVRSMDAERQYFRVSRRGEVRSQKIDSIEVSNKNSFFGFKAGWGAKTESSVFIGFEAGTNTEGIQHTAIGNRSGRNNEGSIQVSIGTTAGFGNSGDFQSAVGSNAGRDNSGNEQSCFGHFSGQNNTGNEQSALGYQAGINNTARGHTTFGYRSGMNNTGIFATHIGNNAGRGNSGGNVVFVGYNSGRDNTQNNVVGIGHEAGRDNDIQHRFIVENSPSSTIPLIDGDFSTGGLAIGTPATPLADSRIGANRMTFYLDEATNKLHVRVKYADGTTIKEGEVALI